MNPTVSVIIPNYNHARFLEERIQSVLNQTYQDFELILLDDCSPDEGASRAIIEQYRSNPHVSHIVYNEVNSGSTFKQWHKGFELAKGNYIWIAESDDSCDRMLLEKLMNTMTKNKASMAFCRSLKYDESGRDTPFLWQEIPKGDFVKDGTSFIKDHLLYKNNVANASSVVFRKDVIPMQNTIYMHMKAVGDWLFWILIAEQCKVCFIDKEMNYFRLHLYNTTKANVKKGIELKESFTVYQYLVQKGYLRKHRFSYIRLKKVYGLVLHPNDEEIQHELLTTWDKYHVYRIMGWLLKMTKKL